MRERIQSKRQVDNGPQKASPYLSHPRSAASWRSDLRPGGVFGGEFEIRRPGNAFELEAERVADRALMEPSFGYDFSRIRNHAHRESGDFGERGLRATPPKEKEVIRGVGDTISDVVDVIGTGLGNVVGGVAGLLTGISIASTTNAGPTFGPQGAAMWHVAFTPTGRTGWIVQKIHNTVNGTDSAGAAMTPASIGLAPDYHEAWSVDAAGTVTPSVGGDNDHWDQGGMGAGSKGHWSTTGALYWVPGAATPAGMAAGAVPNAGMLVSSVAAPPNLGVARLHRYAHASWDATVAPAVDTGSAGPT
jgi:hypothetical protein